MYSCQASRGTSPSSACWRDLGSPSTLVKCRGQKKPSWTGLKYANRNLRQKFRNSQLRSFDVIASIKSVSHWLYHDNCLVNPVPGTPRYDMECQRTLFFAKNRRKRNSHHSLVTCANIHHSSSDGSCYFWRRLSQVRGVYITLSKV